MNKVSILALVAIIFLSLVSLFYLHRVSDAIVEVNSAIQEVKENLMKDKVEGKVTNPHENEKFIAVMGNISTEINRGKTGNIDLENYWPFTGQIASVEIKPNSLNPISNLPSSIPPLQQLSLQNLQSYNGSAGNVAVIGGQRRYINVQAASNEPQGVQLFDFEFKVKYIPCDCWSNYQDGYLSVTVR